MDVLYTPFDEPRVFFDTKKKDALARASDPSAELKTAPETYFPQLLEDNQCEYRSPRRPLGPNIHHEHAFLIKPFHQDFFT